MGKRILIVEHDQHQADLLREGLEDSGHRVTVCLDTGKVLDIARFALPDAIISEVRLGERGGLGLLYELRQRPDLATVPVLFLTGVAPDELLPWRETIAERRATVLHKPAELAAITAWIDAHAS